jgi:hypothetical protein
VLSGDKTDGDEEPAIRKCLAKAAVTKQLTAEAKEIMAQLAAEVEKHGRG